LLVALVLFINYIDRGTLATTARAIQLELHINDAQLGYMQSAFFWIYALMQIPVGWMAERWGGRRMLALGLALWASATLLTGFAQSLFMLFVLRLLLGLGESAGFPCAAKVLAEAVPSEGLGLANGIVGFAYLLGPAVGAYAGGLLMHEYGWRVVFLVFGGASLFWLIPWLRQKPVPREAVRAAGRAVSFGQILRTPALWGTGLGLFSSNYVFYFMLFWLPSYLERERGFSTTEMATLVGSAFAVNAITALAAGWYIDRHIARGGSGNFIYKMVMAATHLGSAASVLLMALGNRPLCLFGIFFYQVLCGVQSPGVYAMSEVLAGPKAAGRWVGVQNCLGSLAGAVTNAATGLFVYYTGGFALALIVAAGVSLFGLVGWIWMIPPLKELDWPAPSPKATVPALT
jgi:MFS family permease